jgi:peptide/nickel transport system substrate-binding protein
MEQKETKGTKESFNTTFISINTELPPLNQVKVRQALNYAVDKPRRMFAASRQFTPARGALPPTMPGYDPTLEGYPFDPEKARRLLAETGLPLPLQMTVWHSHDQLSRMVTEGIQADLNDVGIKVELKSVAAPELIEVAQTRGRAQLCLISYPSFPDPRDIIGVMLDGRTLTNAGSFNLAFYNNPEVNRLIDEAATCASRSQRYRLFQQAERIIVGDAPWIFLGHRNLFALRQPWLKGPILEPCGFYRIDRAWIAR